MILPRYLSLLLSLSIPRALCGGFSASCDGNRFTIDVGAAELGFSCRKEDGTYRSGMQDLNLCVWNDNGNLAAGNESVQNHISL